MKNKTTLSPQTSLGLQNRLITTVMLVGFGVAVMALSLLLLFRSPEQSRPPLRKDWIPADPIMTVVPVDLDSIALPYVKDSVVGP